MIKKILGLLLILCLAFGFYACSSSDSTEETTEENPVEETVEKAVVSKKFKKSMDEYEKWFDKYIKFMKKYKKKPNDLKLAAEATDLMAEEVTMLDEFNKIESEDLNSAELAYYLKVHARIERKLAEIAE